MSDEVQYLARRRYMRAATRDPDGLLAAEEERRAATVEAYRAKVEREQRAREEAARQRAVEERRRQEQKEHDRLQKLNAALIRDYGDAAGCFTCPPACSICHPPAPEAEKKNDLTLRDLRAGKRKGKRGTCKVCGKKCKSPRRVLCDDEECRKESRRQRMVRTCVVCQGPLPEGSRKDKQYCSESCKQKAYRKRKKVRS
jgi:hypothetical protein